MPRLHEKIHKSVIISPEERFLQEESFINEHSVLIKKAGILAEERSQWTDTEKKPRRFSRKVVSAHRFVIGDNERIAEGKLHEEPLTIAKNNRIISTQSYLEGFIILMREDKLKKEKKLLYIHEACEVSIEKANNLILFGFILIQQKDKKWYHIRKDFRNGQIEYIPF